MILFSHSGIFRRNATNVDKETRPAPRGGVAGVRGAGKALAFFCPLPVLPGQPGGLITSTGRSEAGLSNH